MTFPTRLATDDDLFFEHGGKPAMVCISFFGKYSAGHYHTSGFRRPRKVRGKWIINRYGPKNLMVRTDRDKALHPDFVALTWGENQ